MTLTQERAEQRFKCIKQGSIFYDFHVSLQIGSHYNGLSQIRFDLNQIPSVLHLDFNGQEITKLVVNNKQITQIKKEQGFIILESEQLKQQNNIILVIYRTKYDNDGSGCVSFTDVDGKQYIYTQFQSYFANRVFALFDQPDLKARMRLNVISPKEWNKILSNQYSVVENNFCQEDYLNTIQSNCKGLVKQWLYEIKAQQTKMTIFPETKLLPTYLYCFIAGDYQQLKIQKPYNNIPMSLYCIESLYKYMKQMSQFVFEITIESMKFFQKFFGYKYAFSKYDQVFAHEYKWGAMQNAAIVTHNDQYIWKDKVSIQTKLDFANTISHQLAHHWFGNLVTMKWWDDLWLNQSFADYISYLCLENIRGNCHTIKYQSAMSSFCTRKGWGYNQDQLVTTHPIRGPVANTNVADSIFDGITYSKGASTMKQLNFLMSEQKFSAALAEYFHKFQWQNATLDDFINVMENHFTSKQFTLKEWRQLWLEKACCNKIHAFWDSNDKSQKAKIEIKQACVLPQHPTLRMHRVKIGLFKQNGEIDTVQTLIHPKQTSQAFYNGSNNYKAILLNYQDHSFVKNIIDKTSLEYFSANLSSIKDLLSRTLIWRSFYDMVKDAELRGDKYTNTVLGLIVKQSSDSIFQTQLDYLFNAINTFTPIKFRDQLNDQVFLFIYNILATETENMQQNRIVILKQKFLRFAQTQTSIAIVLSWLKSQNQKLKSHEMTLSLKWSAVIKAFKLKSLSNDQKWQFFKAQEQLDPTDQAKNNKYLCQALIATKQQFQKIYNQFHETENLSISVKQSLAHGWNSSVHADWLLEYKDRYFKDIVELAKKVKGDHLSLFYQSLQPIDDDLEGQITKYQEIKLQQIEQGKYDKHVNDIKKIVDQLKKKLKAYNLYSAQ